jgi:hypothetical protein
MNQQNNLLKFKKVGFSPVSKIKDGIVLKSINGVAISYNDGNYEGFVKKQINLNEMNLSKSLKTGGY